jgi:hypothetical protein
LIRSEILLGLPAYQITNVAAQKGEIRIGVRYTGPASCPHGNSHSLRNKGRHLRRVRHENWGQRTCILETAGFQMAMPRLWPILPSAASAYPSAPASQAYQQAIYRQHLDGINRSRLGRREKIGAATVERYFRKGLPRQFQELASTSLPANSRHR